MFFTNRQLAIDLADCCIRLDHWVSKNEACIGCVKGSGKKLKKDERKFQEGKLYAYAFTLERLGYAKFWHPVTSDENYIPLLARGWSLDTGVDMQVFIRKDIFQEALYKNNKQLVKDIIKHRKDRPQLKKHWIEFFKRLQNDTRQQDAKTK